MTAHWQPRAGAWQETTIERETIPHSLRRVPALRVQLLKYQDRVSLARAARHGPRHARHG